MEMKQLLSTEFISITKSHTIADVLKQFIDNRQDIACVIDDDQLIGVVTKYSLYRLLLKTNDINVAIEGAIIRDVITLNESDNIYYSRDKLIEKNVAHAIVLNENKKVVGISSSWNIFQGLMMEIKYASEQLSNLMNNLQSIIISVDLDLEITTLNTSASQFIKKHNITSTQGHIGYMLPEIVTDIIEVIQTNRKVDYKTIELFGDVYICSLIPIQAWNQTTGLMIVLDDISKYERISQELEYTKQIEQTLDSALEIAYDGVVITNPQGEIVKINQAFLELLKLTKNNNVIGKSLKTIVPEIPIEKSITENKQIKGEYIKIRGQKAVVTQANIYRNKQHIGVIIKVLFRQLELWKDLFNHMDQLESEISYYRNKLEEVSYKKSYFDHIISVSHVMNNLKSDALVAAKGVSNVLITGESGTGKDLFAQGIHKASGRTGSFVKINCAAIPNDLLESELFGYEEGAFTGARRGGKLGKLELADDGTLFLDEIGDMPISLQVKLLRVLQDQKFERVGGVKTKSVDIRIITATNRNLLALIRDGKFREDLYYRINVIHLHLPPLRERKEDISYLATHFIDKLNKRMEKKVHEIDAEALRKLTKYDWPGNIRELENIMERAFHFCQLETIKKQDILLDPTTTMNQYKPFKQQNNKMGSDIIVSDSQSVLESTEKKLIIQALQETNGNRTEAAKLLNISRSTLYYKLRKLNIKEIPKYK